MIAGSTIILLFELEIYLIANHSILLKYNFSYPQHN
jgi:hypothetical protein